MMRLHDDDRCGWLRVLTPPSLAIELEGEQRADAVVVGAGFTGLAAARQLARMRPDWRIVVLEGQRAGHGASGRSSGFVVDLAGFIASMPPDQAQTFIELSRRGISLLRTLVQEHGIDCDWDEDGWLHVAAGEQGLRSLAKLTAWLEQRRETHLRLDPDQLKRWLGTDFYRAGVHLPGSVLVQAGALVQGLARSLPESVELYEQSPMTRLEQGKPHRLHTPRGSLRSSRVILALNGYSPSQGWLRRRVFPLVTYGSLSEPLSEEQQQQIGGRDRWGLLAQDPMGSSLRRTVDGRLLIRNTVHYRRHPPGRQSQLESIARVHQRTLSARYPTLTDLRLEHTWAGVMGISPNHSPYFGTLAPGLVSAAGFTAAGIAMGTLCGHLLPSLLLGEENPELAALQSLPPPRWLPPEPFLGLGARAQLWRMNAAALAEL